MQVNMINHNQLATIISVSKITIQLKNDRQHSAGAETNQFSQFHLLSILVSLAQTYFYVKQIITFDKAKTHSIL